jgi:hypothetical protein
MASQLAGGLMTYIKISPHVISHQPSAINSGQPFFFPANFATEYYSSRVFSPPSLTSKHMPNQKSMACAKSCRRANRVSIIPETGSE